jgi:hypothetical protein
MSEAYKYFTWHKNILSWKRSVGPMEKTKRTVCNAFYIMKEVSFGRV